MKKVGAASTGRIGTASYTGKSSPKPGSTIISDGKLPTVQSSGFKSYGSSSYKPSRNNKSSTFGIIWLPGKKRNKHKELVYNSHKNERTGGDRAPSMYHFMSGDSSNHQTHLKTKEESDLLVPQHSGHIPAAVAGAGVAAASEFPPDIVSANSEEKQDFMKNDKEDSKDAAGDAFDNEKKSDNDYFENNDMDKRSQDMNTDKDKVGDNVDSVFLRSPPAHKTRSTASTVEDEDCGIKCLYYTLQCCDCVLM